MDIINSTSESEQMYLVAIARLAELVDECPIPVSKVAEILDVTPISANQMIHQLQQAGWVNYIPYKGVEFTEQGWQAAANILRSRRLWEVFLVTHLQYEPDSAEALACRLEHAIPAETAARLAEFLGEPLVSPQGKPIPPGAAGDAPQPGIPLNSLTAGAAGVVTALVAGGGEQAFLAQAGVQVGARLAILAVQQHGAVLVRSGERPPLGLAAELAQKVHLRVEQ